MGKHPERRRTYVGHASVTRRGCVGCRAATRGHLESGAHNDLLIALIWFEGEQTGNLAGVDVDVCGGRALIQKTFKENVK